MKNTPAFPHYFESEGTGGTTDPGMTLLDYFAAKIAQGIIINPDCSISEKHLS